MVASLESLRLADGMLSICLVSLAMDIQWPSPLAVAIQCTRIAGDDAKMLPVADAAHNET